MLHTYLVILVAGQPNHACPFMCSSGNWGHHQHFCNFIFPKTYPQVSPSSQHWYKSTSPGPFWCHVPIMCLLSLVAVWVTAGTGLAGGSGEEGRWRCESGSQLLASVAPWWRSEQLSRPLIISVERWSHCQSLLLYNVMIESQWNQSRSSMLKYFVIVKHWTAKRNSKTFLFRTETSSLWL